MTLAHGPHFSHLTHIFTFPIAQVLGPYCYAQPPETMAIHEICSEDFKKAGLANTWEENPDHFPQILLGIAYKQS